MLVGVHLSEVAEDQGTFLSRDAGHSWSHIAKGSHIYEMGDHGGLLLMAPDQYSTNKISFSWNEGLTWETVMLDGYVKYFNCSTK
jgi:hypothetical protein